MGDGCDGWDIFNPFCHVEAGAKAVVGEQVQNIANAVMEAFGKAVGSMGTVWVKRPRFSAALIRAAARG